MFPFLDSYAEADGELRKLECDKGASSTAEENSRSGKRFKFFSDSKNMYCTPINVNRTQLSDPDRSAGSIPNSPGRFSSSTPNPPIDKSTCPYGVKKLLLKQIELHEKTNRLLEAILGEKNSSK